MLNRYIKYCNSFIILIAALLCGCSSVKTPAGPTCVSCKPYYCRGSWHYPQTFYEYDQIGLASWYGNDCHGNPKATGEPFDQYAFTAAHKTLPIPSIVRVTNLQNNRSIVVLIDDRGPFVYKGRIIDLSYGAAKALDLHRCKPSPVRVECLVEDSLKLSKYISMHCRNRRDPMGRTWIQLYFQEIAKTHPIQYYTHKPIYSAKKKSRKIDKKRYNKIHRFLDLNKI